LIPTNDLRNFAKYEVITSTRQSDGAKLIATRVIIDERLPVRWDVEITYPQPTTFSTGLVRSRIEPPSTSKLIQKAQEEGFGDWYPVPEKMEEIFPWDAKEGDKSKMQLAPKYPEPDSKDYLVD
jgi:hypothetical protein